MRPAGLKPAVSLDAAECNSAGRTDREVYVPAHAQRGTVFQRFASRAFFNLFQQNAQLCDCFQILSSARRFLNANQRRKINAFKANAESFYLEGMREDTDAQQREVSAGGGSERNVPEFRAL